MSTDTLIPREAITPLIAALTPFVIALVKAVIPSIPKKYIPILTPIVGVLLDGISHLSGFSASNPWGGAFAGMAGSAVRETFDQLKKAGVTPTSIWALLAFLFMGLGCSSISPGSDPVVVNAERTLSASFDLADSFLKWEYTNRSKIPSSVTKYADEIRVKFPTAMSSARSVLSAYKQNKTQEGKDSLLMWLNVLREIDAGIRANFNPNL